MRKLVFVSLFIFPGMSFADNDAKAVKEFKEDIELLKEKSTELSPQQMVGEAGAIMDKLGDNSSDENKRLVEAVKEETMLFYGELAEYDSFLDRIADPSFFNFEKAMDLKNLEGQQALAVEYEKRSGEMLVYAEALPTKIQASLKGKGFSDSTITSVLKGIADAESERKNTPKDILNLRVQHASILKDGLGWLKTNFGKWNFDTNQGYLGFQDPALSTYWESKIVEPLIKTENSINEAVSKPGKA